MKLGIDSSSSHGSVSLVQGDQVLREVEFGSVRGRGSGLHEALQAVLREASLLEAIVVGTGPGSYNGIRSAIASAWGISIVRRIPLHGVSSLLGIAEGEYCAVGDARRSQFYFAVVRDGAFLRPPELLESAVLSALVEEFSSLPIFTPTDLSAVLPHSTVRLTSASRLARLPLGPAVAEIPDPIYLKAPHITQPKKPVGT